MARFATLILALAAVVAFVGGPGTPPSPPPRAAVGAAGPRAHPARRPAAGGACGGWPPSRPSDAERAAVETAVNGYLHALAASYSDLDASRLEAWASPQEIAAVRTLLRGLAATGDRVEAQLRGVEIQKWHLFRTVNASLSLVEVWDVARFDAFTGREKGTNPNSVQNTLLTLRLIDGTWKVTARRVVEDQPRSRWNVTTPVPASGGGAS